jgi:hypothetical protein
MRICGNKTYDIRCDVCATLLRYSVNIVYNESFLNSECFRPGESHFPADKVMFLPTLRRHDECVKTLGLHERTQHIQHLF